MIDAHVHHIDLERFRYPWLDDAALGSIRRNYLPADYREEIGDVGLEGWVHVQAEVDHATDPVAETEWISELADHARVDGLPGPLGCVVYADLRDAELDQLLDRQCADPLTRGVRQEVWYDPESTQPDMPSEDYIQDPAWRRGYAALARHGLSFDMLVWPHQLPGAIGVVAGDPDVPVVLEHLGLPDPQNDPGLQTWRAGIAAMAALPHVHAKLSSFASLGRRDAETIKTVVGTLIEAFGPSRCMFGSNLPVERVAGSFPELWQMFMDAVAELSDPERSAVLVETARRFYRLPG